MTQAEIETLQNIIKRLREPNLGCSMGEPTCSRILALNASLSDDPRSQGMRLEVASRVYLNTWIIPSLEMLLPGPGRNTTLARSMSRR